MSTFAKWLAAFAMLPMVLAGLSVVLAIAGALLPVVPIGQESIITREGGLILLVLLAPSVVAMLGMVALHKWESNRSKVAQWSAWLISCLLLVWALVEIGVGLYFWPSATVLFLATSTQQNRQPVKWIAWAMLLILLAVPSVAMGIGSYTWLHGVALALTLFLVAMTKRVPGPK